MLPLIAKEVASKTVLILIDLSQQRSAKAHPLCRIDEALKQRQLNTLSAILAEARHPPQSAASSIVPCADIVAD